MHNIIILGVTCLLLRDQWIICEEIKRKETAVKFYIANAHMRKANTLNVEGLRILSHDRI